MSDSWTYPDLPGVVQKRANGKASSRWYYQGKNYRRTHPIPWDRKNRGLIKPLHRRFVADIIGGNYEGRRRRTLDRLSEAIDEFFQSQSKRLTPSSRAEFDRAFGYYLDIDMPLKRDSMRYHILKRLDEPPEGREAIMSTTARKYLMRLRSFCAWLVEAGHLESSPMQGVAIPARKTDRKSLDDIFTEEEVMKVVRHYRKRAQEHNDWRYAMQNTEQAILIELVLLTGLRPSEALRGRWEDVSADSWTIWGKASPTKSGDNERTDSTFRDPRQTRDGHARKRYIPLRRTSEVPERQEWYDRVAGLLDELRQYEERHHGWLFGIASTQVANRGLADGLEACEIPRRGRTFRRLRHTARWFMEERLRLDSRTIADVLGHTETVSIRDYRTTPDADTIAERLLRG